MPFIPYFLVSCLFHFNLPNIYHITHLLLIKIDLSLIIWSELSKWAKATYISPNSVVASAHTELESDLFIGKGLLLFFSLSYQLLSNLQKGKNHSLFRKWKLLLFISHNGPFKREIISVSYLGYLIHKLSTFLDAHFMKPAQCSEKASIIYFMSWESHAHQKDNTKIDFNCQATFSHVKDQ